MIPWGAGSGNPSRLAGIPRNEAGRFSWLFLADFKEHIMKL
jgi:hypothetical protein